MFESREFIMNQAALQRSCPGKTVRHFPLTILIVIGSLYLYKKSLKSFFPFQAFLKLYIRKIHQSIHELNITGTFTPLVRIEETIVPD